jgi:hypothetical protein
VTTGIDARQGEPSETVEIGIQSYIKEGGDRRAKLRFPHAIFAIWHFLICSKKDKPSPAYSGMDYSIQL